jgi:uncharacterized membrane protein YgdD (TMEM256/DUF423 family)
VIEVARVFGALGAAFSFLAVALGAFGAHALRSRLDARALDVFEVAVRYQFFHALALLVLAVVLDRWPGPVGTGAGWAFVLGIVVFSGSLYLLVATGNSRWGAVTPLGGVAFLIGWVLLAWHIVRG